MGQVTLFNSEKVSLNFAPTRRNQFGLFLLDLLVAFAILLPQNDAPLSAYVLFGFFVFSVLFAERAVFAHYESVRIVLLVFHRVVISAFALGAFKSDLRSCGLGCHNQNSIQKNYTPFFRCVL